MTTNFENIVLFVVSPKRVKERNSISDNERYCSAKHNLIILLRW
jgi:hypothetical protein